MLIFQYANIQVLSLPVAYQLVLAALEVVVHSNGEQNCFSMDRFS